MHYNLHAITTNETLNKILLYILLLCSPLYVTAQETEDTLVEPYVTADSIEYAEDDAVQEFDTIAERKAPAKVYAAPVYADRSFKPGFRDKYKDDDFKYIEQQPEKSLWERFMDWLFGSSRNKSRSNIDLEWLGPVIKVIAFAVIGFVIYLIVRIILNKEGIWIFGRSRGRIGSEPEDEVINIHEANFKELIEETKAAGNYRLALRYYFLWVLKSLSYREMIRWDRDKTNNDYLYEIKDNALRKDFEYLSYVYDHSWYGDFPIDERAFAKAERSFKKTLNSL
jgi:hypothetical protein